MIRRIEMSGVETSCIGLGCASLGSRVSREAGLAALRRAFEAGVTWYDVAPAYGGGQAEAILGEFARDHRDTVRICTKVGLQSPPRGALYKALLPLARPAVAMIKGLRARVKRSASSRNLRQPLDGPTILTSIDASLSRLGVERVDAFALHSPDPADLARDEVLRALESVLASGKARAVTVAGELDAALAGAGLGAPFSIMQLADDPLDPPLPHVRSRAKGPLNFITHSVFGVDGALAQLEQIVKSDPECRQLLQDAGYEGELRGAIADLLLDRAFASNPGGVVLTSMFSPKHLQTNTDRASRAPSAQSVALVEKLVARAG
jgi:hypothetical protein